MTKAVLALMLSLVVSATGFAQKAPQGADAGEKYFPVDRIVPGLKGYGLTVWEGSKLERFEVEVLGVQKGTPNPKQNLIIARLSGGQVGRTKVFAGMSGSPVYFDGKLAGAVAYSFPFSTEPIAGITPIGQMVEQLDIPAAPVRASGSPAAFKETLFGERESLLESLASLPSRASVPVASNTPSLVPFAGQSLQPIASPLAFGGVPQSVIDRFAPDLARLGIVPVAGISAGAGTSALVPATAETLKPGSSVVVPLIRGDFNAAIAGTVTERQGDKIYAFGHPMLSLGPTEMPMAESEVVVVVPSVNNSFKLASATNTVGSIGQDRSSGIGGNLGKQATMIPIRATVKNDRGVSREYAFEVINDPALTPILVNIGLLTSVMGTERQNGDQTIEVKGSIRVGGLPSVRLENRFSASNNASAAATMSVAQPLAILMNSGFRGVNVEGVDVEITTLDERRLASLTRIWVDRTRVGRGETVTVQAFGRTEEGQEFVERVPIVIPRDAPIGKLGIVVGDGATLASTDETLVNFVPANLRQLVDAFNRLKKNDRLYVKVVRGAGGALVDNTPMTSLPPSVLGSLGSPRATSGYTPLVSATLYEKELAPARHVVTGQQSIVVSVVR